MIEFIQHRFAHDLLEKDTYFDEEDKKFKRLIIRNFEPGEEGIFIAALANIDIYNDDNKEVIKILAGQGEYSKNNRSREYYSAIIHDDNIKIVSDDFVEKALEEGSMRYLGYYYTFYPYFEDFFNNNKHYKLDELRPIIKYRHEAFKEQIQDIFHDNTKIIDEVYEQFGLKRINED